MKEEKLFEMLEDIDEKYISEATEKNGKNWRTIRVIAACFVLFISVGFVIVYIKKNLFGTSYKVIATEIGKAKIQYGATMPAIIYSDADKIIMYDYVGIWVYDFGKKELVGFCDFRPLNMTQIQGYPCVLVEAIENGKYVKFYMSDGSQNYIYDVENDSYEKISDFADYSNENCVLKDVTDVKSLSEYSETYEIADDMYVSYTLDISNKKDTDDILYGDIYIIVEISGQTYKYRPFLSE